MNTEVIAVITFANGAFLGRACHVVSETTPGRGRCRRAEFPAAGDREHKRQSDLEAGRSQRGRDVLKDRRNPQDPDPDLSCEIRLKAIPRSDSKRQGIPIESDTFFGIIGIPRRIIGTRQ